MSKTRVFVSENGDYEGAPTIVVVKEGVSFGDFLKKCADKMKVEKEFKRCFYISNGAEVDDPEDLMPDDKLFVSEGEDFKAKASAGMLSGALGAISRGSSSLYTSVSGFAKSKMSDDMKTKFESTERTISDTVTPGLEKIKEVSKPAIQWTDKKLEIASDRLSEKKKQFLASDTGKYLTEKTAQLSMVAKPVAASASTKAKDLWDKTYSECKKIGAQGQEKMVPLAEYMKKVKTNMGKEWDEKYAPAVKHVWEQAKEQGTATKEIMQKKWNEEMEPLIKEHMEKAKKAMGGEKKTGDDVLTLEEPGSP